MLSKTFLHLINVSIMASWLVLAIVIFRLLFKKAPKYITCALWALVAIRLIFPISIESPVSLIPSEETIPLEIEYSQAPAIDTGIDSLNTAFNPVIQQNFTPTGELTSINPIQLPIHIGAYLWQIGVVLMTLYALISYIRIRIKVRERIKQDKNIYICDLIPSPFILGIIRPNIYLPSHLSVEDAAFVIAHENAHIKRLDYIWKPLGYILLTIYWFNPLLWLGYILLCRDIEYACDEKVAREMSGEEKKGYSEALLNLSIHRPYVTACPLAFGESGVKGRIISVLNYKKPTFWVIAISIVLCIAMVVCFLTNPITKEDFGNVICEYFAFTPLQSATIIPSITFYENNKFSFSSYSSMYTPYGEYELIDTKLYLYPEDKQHTYIFTINKNSFIFDAEISSEVSGKSISSGDVTAYPIPDGTEYIAKPISYSEIEFDFDKDGNLEQCSISKSNPSIMWEDDGIRFVSISKEYMDSHLYSGYITCKDFTPSFAIINEELKIRLEYNHGSVVNYLDISSDDRQLIFTENTELLEGYPEDIRNHMIIIQDQIDFSDFKDGLNDDILKEYYKQDIEEVTSITTAKHIVIRYFDYDFNSDDLTDKFVIVASPLHSGLGGDTIDILINNGDGTYSDVAGYIMRILNHSTMEIVSSIYISTPTNGYHDIKIFGEQMRTLVFDGKEYVISTSNLSNTKEETIYQEVETITKEIVVAKYEKKLTYGTTYRTYRKECDCSKSETAYIVAVVFSPDKPSATDPFDTLKHADLTVSLCTTTGDINVKEHFA